METGVVEPRIADTLRRNIAFRSGCQQGHLQNSWRGAKYRAAGPRGSGGFARHRPSRKARLRLVDRRRRPGLRQRAAGISPNWRPRAWREHQAGAGSHPDVIGMRFNLSPNLSARVDILRLLRLSQSCTAQGPGVYPGRGSAVSAHQHRQLFDGGVRDRSQRPGPGRSARAIGVAAGTIGYATEAILGIPKAYLRQVLNENDITTRWRDLRDGYQQRGYD